MTHFLLPDNVNKDLINTSNVGDLGGGGERSLDISERFGEENEGVNEWLRRRPDHVPSGRVLRTGEL